MISVYYNFIDYNYRTYFYQINRIDHIFFIHSWIHGSCLPLAIAVNAAINICIWVSVWVLLSLLLGIHLCPSGIAGAYDYSTCNFWGTTELFSSAVAQFYIPTLSVQIKKSNKSSSFTTSFLTLIFWVFWFCFLLFLIAILVGMKYWGVFWFVLLEIYLSYNTV